MQIQANQRIKPSVYVLVFIILVSFYVALSPAHLLTTPDEELNIRTTLSLLEGQRGAIPPLPMGFATKRGIDGKQYAQYGLGLPLATVPWCFIGKVIDPSEDTSPNYLENIGETSQAGTYFLRWWMTIFTMMITALMVLIWIDLFQKAGLSSLSALFFGFILAFCTYLWPHGRTFFTEPLTAFCLSGAVWSFVQHKYHSKHYKWILIAGIFWAYALFTRIDTVFTAPVALWFLLTDEQDQRIRFSWDTKKFIIFSLPFAVIIISMLLYNQYRFDSLFSTGYEDQAEKIRFRTPLLVGLHGFLFTPGRSLFLYSPPLIFLIWGTVRIWKRIPWFCSGVILVSVCYLAAMSKWQNWAGGYDWGPRHIFQITPFLMLLAIGFFLDRHLFDHYLKKIGWILLIGLSLFIQFLGLAADAVLVIKESVYSGVQQFSNVVLMQFMIYLPQFSSPVKHWDFILRHGPDFVFIRLFQASPFLGFLYLFFPLAVGSIAIFKLYQYVCFHK